MTETTLRNGQRLNGQGSPATSLAQLQASENKQLLSAVDNNTPLQQVLARVSTPAGKLLKMISKAIGPAEAEIEFVERITIRED
ncbi:MAG: hypothetical protein HZA46_16005 [Planctomycetales bacterium]|nr:hypothetical protein [Planctomycetales bacterium]